MTSHWIFQGNPRQYDIDAALSVLTDIRWRVPQYTGSVAPGDEVVLWRSGDEAGIVGVGRITGPAMEMPSGAEEAQFVLDSTHEGQRTTRVPMAVRPAPFVAKAAVAALSQMAGHQILTAPMGTVFPLTDAQWGALHPLLPKVPTYEPSEAPTLPPAFAWGQRRKDVYPLPGGYGGYLTSLEMLLREVSTSQPGRAALESFASQQLGVTETSARLSVGFLLRIGLLTEAAGTTTLGPIAEQWLEDNAPEPLIALLHSRVRFVGELLNELREPRTDTEILEIANEHFAMGWQTKAQIRRRRGWLESSGMITETDDGRLVATPSGLALIERLELRARGTDPSAVVLAAAPTVVPPVEVVSADVVALIERLGASAADGTSPDRFEQDAAEAFQMLGFDARWLGGAGRTDVLLEADLGRDASYRVVVDCKSTSRGTVSHQIDWDTIDEHRAQHRADYAAIVAGAFGGGRLPDRAERHNAIMLTVDDLAELLRQHAQVPLSLDAYRLLFTANTTEDGLAAVGEVAQDAQRRAELAQTVVQLLRQNGTRLGALSARDLMLLLTMDAELPDATEEEIAEVLEPLASPLLDLVTSDHDGHVRPTGAATTAAARLRSLADRLEASSDEGAEPGA